MHIIAQNLRRFAVHPKKTLDSLYREVYNGTEKLSDPRHFAALAANVPTLTPLNLYERLLRTKPTKGNRA